MNERGYKSFCDKYELNPNDFDDVLWALDEMEGRFGDASGKLQSVREYIYSKLDLSGEIKDSKYFDTVKVYQIVNAENCHYRFMSYDFATRYGGVNFDDYDLVATIDVTFKDGEDVSELLDRVFAYGNSNQEYYANNPRARSISVSDILEFKGVKYYVDDTGFVPLDKSIVTEDINEDTEEDNPDDEYDYDKTALDYLDDLQNRQMSVAELNVVLQSIFGRFNDIFIIESDLYNADLDETQELDVLDDDDLYIIKYDIIDVQDGIIEVV